MLVEAGIVALLSLAAWRAMAPKNGVMTPKMRAIYAHALNKDDPPVAPDQLCELAAILDSLALTSYGDELRKRAAIRARSPEVKKAHLAAYRKGMASKDPMNVRVLAQAFERQGMTRMAASLTNYAATLDSAELTSPLMTPPNGLNGTGNGGNAAGMPAASYSSVPADGAAGSLVPPSAAESILPLSNDASSSSSSSATSGASSLPSSAAAPSEVSGDDGMAPGLGADFDEFANFGAQGGILPSIAAGLPTDTAPASTAPATTSSDDAAGNASASLSSATPDDASIAASLGYTDAQYAAFKAGTLPATNSQPTP